MTRIALHKSAAIASILLGAVFAQQAVAQPTYVPQQRRADVPPAMVGAGGRGGSGGNPDGVAVSRDGVALVNTNSPYTTHVRSSAPPPMDPSRLINQVDCTRPFDPFRGNLFCI